MAQIIVKCRHIKNPSSSNAGKYLKYIGTRDGVEKLPYGYDDRHCTKKQTNLINSIAHNFPDTCSYPEYQEYFYNPSRSNASIFIDKAIKENESKMQNMKTIMRYIAERPGVEKLGSHGLFSADDNRINLDEISDRVSNHNGTVWTEIISLTREDAERLGYNNANAWKELIKRNQIEIAQAHKINPTDLEWYAAYHDKDHHPHIHLVLFSKSGDGFLTENGIKQLKSTLANDIFHNERYKLFTLQTEVRNDIKAEVDKLLNNFAYNHYNYSYTDDGIEIFQLMQTLKKELNTVKGKKVYGYLPKDIKLTVDTILDRLYFEPTVNQLFLKWNKLNNMKLSTYYDNKVNPIILLSENKEFQFLKNMIIREVDAMQISNEQYTSNDYPIPAFNLAHQVAFSLANAIEGLQNKMRAKIPKMVESKERQKIIEKMQAQGIKREIVQEKKEEEPQQSGFGLFM